LPKAASQKGLKYNLWEEINEPSCYPTKSDIRKSVNLFFNERFNDYAKKYTSTLIPTDNYDLSFNEKEGSIEIIGIATQNILIPPYPAKYKENFLPTLSEGEQECLSKEGYVPFFIGNSFVRCIECPKKASCGNYIDEVYCNMDPCNLGCSNITPGDLNADNKIDVIDLSILLSNFNSHPSPGTGADINGDGIVNVIDLSILLSNYGR